MLWAEYNKKQTKVETVLVFVNETRKIIRKLETGVRFSDTALFHRQFILLDIYKPRKWNAKIIVPQGPPVFIESHYQFS